MISSDTSSDVTCVGDVICKEFQGLRMCDGMCEHEVNIVAPGRRWHLVQEFMVEPDWWHQDHIAFEI